MRARGVAIVVGAIGATAAIALAAPPREQARPAEACAPGARLDPERTARVERLLERALRQLAGDDDARRLAATRWRSGAVCYGETSELREPASMSLERGYGDRTAAARAAHLAFHAWVVPPWAKSERSCEARVAAALAAERRARALEQRVAGVLGAEVAPAAGELQLKQAYAERCARETR